MATPTYDLLASYETTNTTSFSFTSISQDYKDLILVCSGSYSPQNARFNNEVDFVYPTIGMQGNGSTVTVPTSNTDKLLVSLDTGIAITQILDYSQTDKHKPILQRMSTISDDPLTLARATAGRYINLAAITSIDFVDVRGSVGNPAKFYLYGIAA